MKRPEYWDTPMPRRAQPEQAPLPKIKPVFSLRYLRYRIDCAVIRVEYLTKRLLIELYFFCARQKARFNYGVMWIGTRLFGVP